MKRNLLMLFVICFTLTFFAQGVMPQSGEGTSEAPYQVESLDNLVWISNNQACWNSYFIQVNDIDASASLALNNGMGFKPIGDNYNNYDSNKFSGNYNGNGYKITNLFINRPNHSNIGLFGYVLGGKIRNLELENVDINGQSAVGAVAGLITEYACIEGCSVTGNIVAHSQLLGGITGLVSHNSEIYLSTSNATINGDYKKVGGIAGALWYNSSISNCSSMSDVTGLYYFIGGITGESVHNSTIQNCSSSGNINGYDYVGGLIGKNDGAIINSYAEGDVTGNSRIGGFVGENNGGNIENCYATGNVNASGINSGGFVASNSNNANIEHCYSTGNVTGYTNVGLFAGFNGGDSTIENVLYLNTDPDYVNNELGMGFNQSGNSNVQQMDIFESTDQITYSNYGFNFNDIWLIDGAMPYLPWVSARISLDIEPIYLVNNTQFEALSGTDVFSINDNIMFMWDFNSDGIIDSNATNPMYQFSEVGDYTVTLTVRDTDNNRESIYTRQVVVIDQLIANFTVNNQSPEIGEMVQFTDLSGGDPISWEWDFDNDGNIDSYEQNPSYSYETSSHYSVSLTVTNAYDETNTLVMTDYISTFGEVQSIIEVSNLDITLDVEAGTEIQFVNASTGVYTSSQWNLAGEISFEENPAYTFMFQGQYQVDLTVANQMYQSTSSIIVNVVPKENPESNNWQGSIAITQNHTIDEDSTLVIQAGAEVILSEGASLNIEGTVEAQNVNFRSNGNGWEGMYFSNDQRESMLEDCSFEDASTAIIVDHAELNLSHCMISRVNQEEGERYAIQVINNGAITIDSLEIAGYNEGIRIIGSESRTRNISSLDHIKLSSQDSLNSGKGLYVEDSDIIINNSEFNNFAGGIELTSTDNTRNRSNVTLNNVKLSKADGGASSSGLKVSNTQISTNGIDISGYDIGIELDDNDGLDLTLMTGVRVKNSSNSSRTDRIGIKVANVRNIEIAADSLINVEQGIVLSNESELQSNQVKIRDTNLINTEETRNERTGIKALGSYKVEIENINIEGFSTGIDIDNNGSFLDDEGLDIPLMTGVRVKNSSNSSRTTSRGIAVGYASAPQINNVDIEDYDIGIELKNNHGTYDDTQELIPLMTGVRVKNSSNSSRGGQYGIFVDYKCSPEIDDIDIEGYDYGIYFNEFLDDNEDLIAPLMTGVRVKNSSNSSRTDNAGIRFDCPASPTLEDMEIRGFTNGIYFETGNDFTLVSEPTFNNITIRNNYENSSSGIVLYGLYNVTMDYIDIDSTKTAINIINQNTEIQTSADISNINLNRSYDFPDYDEIGIHGLGNVLLNVQTGAISNYPKGISYNSSGIEFVNQANFWGLRLSYFAEDSESSIGFGLYDISDTYIDNCVINGYHTAIHSQAIYLSDVEIRVENTVINGRGPNNPGIGINTIGAYSNLRYNSYNQLQEAVSISEGYGDDLSYCTYAYCNTSIALNNSIAEMWGSIFYDDYDIDEGYIPLDLTNNSTISIYESTFSNYQTFGILDNSQIYAHRSIFWSEEYSEAPFIGENQEISINYSLINSGETGIYGYSNIYDNPMFIDTNNHDYTPDPSTGITGLGIGAKHHNIEWHGMLKNVEETDYYYDGYYSSYIVEGFNFEYQHGTSWYYEYQTLQDFNDIDDDNDTDELLYPQLEIGKEVVIETQYNFEWVDQASWGWSGIDEPPLMLNYFTIYGEYYMPEDTLINLYEIDCYDQQALSNMGLGFDTLYVDFSSPNSPKLIVKFNEYAGYNVDLRLHFSLGNYESHVDIQGLDIIHTEEEEEEAGTAKWINDLDITERNNQVHISWQQPEDVESRNVTYQIYESHNLSDYEQIGSSSDLWFNIVSTDDLRFYKVKYVPTRHTVNASKKNLSQSKAIKRKSYRSYDNIKDYRRYIEPFERRSKK